MSYINYFEQKQEQESKNKSNKTELKECLITALKEIAETFNEAGGGEIRIAYKEGNAVDPHYCKIMFFPREDIREVKK